MPVVETNLLKQGELRADNLQLYNGLDCCVTYEVFEQLDELLNNNDPNYKRNADPVIYNFSRAMQAPALEMMMRGWHIDEYERRKSISELRTEIMQYNDVLQEMSFAVWDRAINPRSRDQLLALFYGVMSLPEIKISIKGERKVSMNREVLEKLELYLHARPIIACILSMRDIYKQLDVLESEVDTDGRMRTSYNIAGTETGRWSSSYTSIGTGTNLQNLGPSSRRMFIADPGYKLVGVDLQQTESYDVGWLCGTILGDWSYFDACMAGDLHTAVSKLIWPDLGWTGDRKKDRAIADQEYYREFTYRYMAKRGGHASNYLTTPWTMSRALKIPRSIAEGFQNAYFTTFACIPRWHRWTAEQLQTTHLLTTPFGRHRHFFGRANDDTTLREAVAFVPQGTTADRLNLGLWRIWKHMGMRVQILAQVHDALYFQYREDDNVTEIVAQAQQLMRVEQRHKDRTLVVPGEAKTGWNWGEYCCGQRNSAGICSISHFLCNMDSNPNGMKKFNPAERDVRVQQKGLDRVL